MVNQAMQNYQHPIVSSNPELVANSVVIKDNEQFLYSPSPQPMKVIGLQN